MGRGPYPITADPQCGPLSGVFSVWVFIWAKTVFFKKSWVQKQVISLKRPVHTVFGHPARYGKKLGHHMGDCQRSLNRKEKRTQLLAQPCISRSMASDQLHGR